MTLGASTIAAAATAAIAPPAFTMPLRRSVVTQPCSDRDELMVGAFRDVVPGTHERLELRERRVHLPGHGGLRGLFPDDLGRQLLEIAQHGHREREQLDLALELCLEPFERDCIPRLAVREAVALDRGSGVVERPPQIARARVMRRLLESDFTG